MTTTIDNNQRKFWIAGQGIGGQADIICNLHEIPTVIDGVVGTKGGYKIYELFNRKWKACSKKHINEMFVANNVNFKISSILKTMEIMYCIASKESGKHGKNYLQSFASKPLWKDSESLRRQKQTAGTWYKTTAIYALKKYANEKDYEIITESQAAKELKEYIKMCKE